MAARRPMAAHGRISSDGELGDRLDLSRMHFTGKVPYPDFLRLMQVSAGACLSDLSLRAVLVDGRGDGAGALVVGSRTAPVQEVIRHGENGLLVDFFDIDGWSRVLTDALADPARYAPCGPPHARRRCAI
jgi:glycosyltransferase involved in cell wall biosynthesis